MWLLLGKFIIRKKLLLIPMPMLICQDTEILIRYWNTNTEFLSTKFLHQEIRWNYGILSSVMEKYTFHSYDLIRASWFWEKKRKFLKVWLYLTWKKMYIQTLKMLNAFLMSALYKIAKYVIFTIIIFIIIIIITVHILYTIYHWQLLTVQVWISIFRNQRINVYSVWHEIKSGFTNCLLAN